MTKLELAIKVVNLRRRLELANKLFAEKGEFGILPEEDKGPTFTEGKTFWAEVNKLVREER
jgi:hypothetical protein